MLIIATFKHSAYLALALKLLEQKPHSKESSVVAPLEKQPRDALSDWALIGIIIGATLGLIIEAIMGKRPFKWPRDTECEVVLMIACHPQETNTVQSILWKHQAIGVSKIENCSEE